jgi:hypothetical protein
MRSRMERENRPREERHRSKRMMARLRKTD